MPRLTVQIKALDEPLRKRLAAIPENQRWLVTSEGAFSDLARDYGMREAYLCPSRTKFRSCLARVRFLIAQPSRSRRETGARYGGVLYVDSLSAASDRCRPISIF
jgi:manganese/iron transport system substrate-binding protein